MVEMNKLDTELDLPGVQCPTPEVLSVTVVDLMSIPQLAMVYPEVYPTPQESEDKDLLEEQWVS